MALRREVRLRKEYLHQKQQSLQQRSTLDKKRQLREALDEGASLTHSLTRSLIRPLTRLLTRSL